MISQKAHLKSAIHRTPMVVAHVFAIALSFLPFYSRMGHTGRIFFMTAVLLLSSASVPANAGGNNKFAGICNKIMGRQAPMDEQRRERRLSLLRMMFNFPSPLQRPVALMIDGQGSHGDSVFRTFNSNQIFGRGDDAPIKTTLNLIYRIEAQGDEFAWAVHDQYLALLRDSKSEALAESLSYSTWKDAMERKVNQKYGFYFDQDPSQTNPTFLHPPLFNTDELNAIRGQHLDQQFANLKIENSKALTQKTIDENEFTVDRDQIATQKLIGYGVFKYLDSTQLAGDWYDIGSALSKLQRSRLKNNGPLKTGHMYSVTPNMPTAETYKKAKSDQSLNLPLEIELRQFYRDLERYSNSFSYLHGAYLEQRSDLKPQTAMLLTDIMGALSYSHDWKSVMMAEGRLLKPKGILVSHRTASRIVTADGEVLDWFEFADQYGTGLKLKKAVSKQNAVGKLGVIMERTDEPMSMPDLEMIYSTGWGAPPSMIYICKSCRK